MITVRAFVVFIPSLATIGVMLVLTKFDIESLWAAVTRVFVPHAALAAPAEL